MMKVIGHIDPRIGSAFDGSSNSGSDITLHLFNRLRAQQQKQNEQRDKEKMVHTSPQASTTQPLPVDPQQIHSLFQHMMTMSPQQQSDYLT